MRNYESILERTSLQQLRSFLLEGAESEIDESKGYSYKRKIEESEKPIYDLLEQTFSDDKSELDNATDKLLQSLYTNADVYFELGIKAGAKIIYELLAE